MASTALHRIPKPMSRIHVLHENPAWLPPLAEAFDRHALPWTEWLLDGGAFDLSAQPPAGVFYNRMSASSHTRHHRFSAELTAAVRPGDYHVVVIARHGGEGPHGPALLRGRLRY